MLFNLAMLPALAFSPLLPNFFFPVRVPAISFMFFLHYLHELHYNFSVFRCWDACNVSFLIMLYTFQSYVMCQESTVKVRPIGKFNLSSNLFIQWVHWPVTVASRSKTWTVFARSKSGIVGSNPTLGMDVCLRLFCVCICSGLVTGWYLIQGVLPTVLGLRNWSETKRFTDALCSKVGATGKREREWVQWALSPRVKRQMQEADQ
jgi:hypothetical protein